MKAFPYKSLSGESWDNGMDLRDYFASRAMQGLLSSLGEWSSGSPNCEFSDALARDAYWIADSMLRERNTNESHD
jgi:hypothetical protein